jgi:conjugative transfer region lipoprotein (TIGR03751 family)
VPNKGLTMEQVYDSGEDHSSRLSSIPVNAVSREFKKLPNPELTMYVYPHVAGKEQVPIPGYETVFSAYTEEHYALPNEMIRDYNIELY